MRLRRKRPEPEPVDVWRAGYGWKWQGDNELDEVAEFDTWLDAQHWLRHRITECTGIRYSVPHMEIDSSYRYVTDVGQDFVLWRPHKLRKVEDEV